MATVFVGLAATSIQTTYGAVALFAIQAAAAVIDSKFILPELQKNRPDQMSIPKLQELPVGSNDAGAPRIYALGNRVRVPTHVLWQDQKTLEDSTTTGGNWLKPGTTVTQRRTYFDCLLALNDRKTQALVQLIGNGKLLVWNDRNTVFIRASSMTYSFVGPHNKVAMGSFLDPSFNEKFQVGDPINLKGFTPSVGNAPSNTYRITAVFGHAAEPSYIEIVRAQGQAPITTGASSLFPPATVARDDSVCITNNTCTLGGSGGFTSFRGRFPRDQVLRVLSVGASVTITGYASGSVILWPGWIFQITAINPVSATEMEIIAAATLIVPIPGYTQAGSLTTFGVVNATSHWAMIKVLQQPAALGFFPPNWNPVVGFGSGSTTAARPSLLVQSKGSTYVSGYRGVAVQEIDDFYVNVFGNQLPFSLEAIIDIDVGMTWRTALETICRERAGFQPGEIDTSGVTPDPFEGYYIRGSSSAGLALQPLLVAKQIVTQERPALAFFEIANADIVQIENGPVFSHLGARLAKSSNEESAKYKREESTIEELSTSYGIRHQDPDNIYAAGYQTFGLRGPDTVQHQKNSQIDLGTLVLSRREARTLGQTLIRREWVNSVTFQIDLPICYAYLLENDLVTFTDDDGEDILCRVVTRDIGANYIVRLECVQESLDVPTQGSPAQPSYLDGPSYPLPRPTRNYVVALAVPALKDEDVDVPGVYVGSLQTGPSWTQTTVFESSDINPEWSPVLTFDAPTVGGTFVENIPVDPTAFPAGTRWAGGVPDPSSLGFGDLPNVEVPWGSLVSATIEEVNAGKNWIAVYDEVSATWEIMAFTDVIATASPIVWQINIVRRGLRGTWPASMNEKPAGAQFVLLSTVKFRPLAGNRAGTSLAYKGVPEMGLIEDAPGVSVRARNANAAPGPVRSITRTDNDPSAGDVSITIDLRGIRTNETEDALAEAPMRETGERFVVEFLDPRGINTKRRKDLRFEGSGLSLQRSRRFVYTSAEQLADGYTTPSVDPIWIRVWQVGEYGDGAKVKVQLF